MFILSPDNLATANELSRLLLSKNGWVDQFTITKKILNKYSSVVDNLAVNRTADNLIKSIVDVMIVSQHLINHLNITDSELSVARIAKLTRTFTGVLNCEYAGEDMQTAAISILNAACADMGSDTGSKYQLYIASEEAGELAKEISKYQRHSLIGDVEKLTADRYNIIEELFDTIYTILYVMLIANITASDLDAFVKTRITRIKNENKLG